MHVAKGLIIADPWIGYILDGTKTWEMRSSDTALRGAFAIIRKGTGAIWGTASLVDVGQALTPTEMIATFDKHRIPTDMIRSGAAAKWNVPWILDGVRRLVAPVPYDHPNGAVTWVNLAENVSRAIAVRFDDASSAATLRQTPSGPSIKSNSEREEMPATPGKGTGSLVAQTQLTDGNIKHNHFYLRGYLHRFPSDLVGGSNRVARASKEAVIDWTEQARRSPTLTARRSSFAGAAGSSSSSTRQAHVLAIGCWSKRPAPIDTGSA